MNQRKIGRLRRHRKNHRFRKSPPFGRCNYRRDLNPFEYCGRSHFQSRCIEKHRPCNCRRSYFRSRPHPHRNQRHTRHYYCMNYRRLISSCIRWWRYSNTHRRRYRIGRCGCRLNNIGRRLDCIGNRRNRFGLSRPAAYKGQHHRKRGRLGFCDCWKCIWAPRKQETCSAIGRYRWRCRPRFPRRLRQYLNCIGCGDPHRFGY